MKKSKTYNILSPDGITIEQDGRYKSIKAAKTAFEKWAARFAAQGYYSSNSGRIPLSELESHCTLIEL